MYMRQIQFDQCPDEETTVMATIGNKRVAFSLASHPIHLVLT